MMSDLGVIDQPSISNERWFKQLTEEQPSLTIIQEKEELTTVFGVIIPLMKKEKLPLVVDWLRVCQSKPRLFIWIFSTVPLDYEQELLMELGANEVVTDETQIHHLSLIIKNTFQRIKGATNSRLQSNKPSFINESNQSVFINGDEMLLTKMEYNLFVTLYQRENEAVSYEDLVAIVWPNNKKANLYTLANIIFHLRNKIKESDDFYIKNIRNKGYMLTTKK